MLFAKHSNDCATTITSESWAFDGQALVLDSGNLADVLQRLFAALL